MALIQQLEIASRVVSTWNSTPTTVTRRECYYFEFAFMHIITCTFTVDPISLWQLTGILSMVRILSDTQISTIALYDMYSTLQVVRKRHQVPNWSVSIICMFILSHHVRC